jgi:hypothetical protein
MQVADEFLDENGTDVIGKDIKEDLFHITINPQYPEHIRDLARVTIQYIGRLEERYQPLPTKMEVADLEEALADGFSGDAPVKVLFVGSDPKYYQSWDVTEARRISGQFCIVVDKKSGPKSEEDGPGDKVS